MKYAFHFLSLSLCMFLFSCSTFSQNTPGKEEVAGTSITAKVRSEFARSDEVGILLAVEVDTQGGVVQLSGFVSSTFQRYKAEKIARSVAGVTTVKNQIHVK